jgi:hypothetical protein
VEQGEHLDVTAIALKNAQLESLVIGGKPMIFS